MDFICKSVGETHFIAPIKALARSYLRCLLEGLDFENSEHAFVCDAQTRN